MKTLVKLLAVFLIVNPFTANSQQPCQANFVYTLGANGLITFSNTSVVNSTNTPTYNWDLGNGNTFTTTSLSQTVSTTYSSNGTYTAVLTVSQPTNGCYSTKISAITYSNPACGLKAGLQVVYPSTASSPTVLYSNTTVGDNSNTVFTWDFDDGTISNMANPAPHTYSMNGFFGVTLTAVNSATCSSFVKIPSVTYGAGGSIWMVACSSTPVLSYVSGSNGQRTLTLSGVKPGPSNQGYWNFGDYAGAYYDVSSIAHTYFNGTYTAKVYGAMPPYPACSYNETVSITVTDHPCLSDAAFSNTVGSGGAVQFAVSNPVINGPIQYLWVFGDGAYSTQPNPIHTYPSAGTYTVNLWSYDTLYPVNIPADPNDTLSTFFPCRDKNSISLNVTGIPCVANANFNLTHLYEHYYNATPVFPYNVSQATWDWGDGTSSNQLYAWHTYSAAGSYDICLTVTTSCGSTSSSCYNQNLLRGTEALDMIYINVSPPASVLSVNKYQADEQKITVYPNPAKSEVFLDFSKEVRIKEIEVFDLVGKKILSVYPENETKHMRIDLSDQLPGIYLVRAVTTHGVLMPGKIVLEK